MSVCNVFYGWQQQHYAKSQCNSSDCICIYLIAKEAFQIIHLFLRQEHKAKSTGTSLSRALNLYLSGSDHIVVLSAFSGTLPAISLSSLPIGAKKASSC